MGYRGSGCGHYSANTNINREHIIIYWMNLEQICDTIEGNESLVENFNFNFLTPLSKNFKMLHFDANPVTIGYLVTEL